MPEQKFLSKINASSMVDMVLSRLTNAILDGELQPGEQIPTEAELVKSFGVGRNTVREAIRILVSYGILVIRRADGTYVADQYSPNILNPMLYGIILQKNGAYKDLIELRKMIDVSVLILLHSRGMSEDDVSKIRCKQADLEEYIHSGGTDTEIILEKDIAFHHQIALCTENAAVITTYDTIVTITKDFQKRTINKFLETGHAENLLTSHKNIVESLLQGDSNEVQRVLNQSYSVWFED